MKHLSLILTRLCFYAYGCSEYYDESGNIMKKADDRQKIMIIKKTDDRQKILMIVRKF